MISSDSLEDIWTSRSRRPRSWEFVQADEKSLDKKSKKMINLDCRTDGYSLELGRNNIIYSSKGIVIEGDDNAYYKMFFVGKSISIFFFKNSNLKINFF